MVPGLRPSRRDILARIDLDQDVNLSSRLLYLAATLDLGSPYYSGERALGVAL